MLSIVIDKNVIRDKYQQPMALKTYLTPDIHEVRTANQNCLNVYFLGIIDFVDRSEAAKIRTTCLIQNNGEGNESICR